MIRSNSVRSDPPGIRVRDILNAIHVADDEEIDACTLDEPLLTEHNESSARTEAVIVAVSSDDNIENNHEQQEQFQATFLQNSKVFASLIGFIVGCFIQFSSLGANFLLHNMYGSDFFLHKKYVIYASIWCFIPSVMGVLILMFLRGLVVVAFRATTGIAREATSSTDSNRDFIARIIVSIEYCFAIFSLVGVCLSWALTDILLDMRGHVIHSLGVLVSALIWCKFVEMCCFKTHLENASEELLYMDEELLAMADEKNAHDNYKAEKLMAV